MTNIKAILKNRAMRDELKSVVTKSPLTTSPPSTTLEPAPQAYKKQDPVKSNIVAAKTTQIVDKEKIIKFQNNLEILMVNSIDQIISFFKARPKDIFFLGYDKELLNFATSINGKVWTKLTKNELKFCGYIPVPERGTIWQSRTSKALFIILEFVNCKGILNTDEVPSIVYMDELGNTRISKITDWYVKFVFCDHTVGKD